MFSSQSSETTQNPILLSYYGIMLMAPVIQGALARTAGSAVVTFDAAAVSLLVAIPLLGLFAVLARKSGQSLAIAA
jgi:hypothetical protein